MQDQSYLCADCGKHPRTDANARCYLCAMADETVWEVVALTQTGVSVGQYAQCTFVCSAPEYAVFKVTGAVNLRWKKRVGSGHLFQDHHGNTYIATAVVCGGNNE